MDRSALDRSEDDDRDPPDKGSSSPPGLLGSCPSLVELAWRSSRLTPPVGQVLGVRQDTTKKGTTVTVIHDRHRPRGESGGGAPSASRTPRRTRRGTRCRANA